MSGSSRSQGAFSTPSGGSNKKKRGRESRVHVGAGASAGGESTAAPKAPAASAPERIRAKVGLTFEKHERVKKVAVNLHLRSASDLDVCCRDSHNI